MLVDVSGLFHSDGHFIPVDNLFRPVIESALINLLDFLSGIC